MYRILVVDDEKDERAAISYVLRKYNFPLIIEEAKDGREAFNKLSEKKFDILCTDVRMPFLLGTDLAFRAKELHPDIQIIFFSGYDDFPYVKKALLIGAVDYILKPINSEELKKIMNKAIQRLDAQTHTVIREKLASVYLQNHILSRLINGADIAALHKEYKNVNLNFTKRYNRLFLLQFDEPVFGWFTQEQFEKSVADSLDGQPYHFLNLNLYQSVILLQIKQTDASLVTKTAKFLQHHFTLVFKSPCYLSISNPLTGTDSLPTVTADEPASFTASRQT